MLLQLQLIESKNPSQQLSCQCDTFNGQTAVACCLCVCACSQKPPPPTVSLCHVVALVTLQKIDALLTSSENAIFSEEVPATLLFKGKRIVVITYSHLRGPQ